MRGVWNTPVLPSLSHTHRCPTWTERNAAFQSSVLASSELHRQALVWHYSPGRTVWTSHTVVSLLRFFWISLTRRGGSDTQFVAHPCVTYQTWHQTLVSISNVSHHCIPAFRVTLTAPRANDSCSSSDVFVTCCPAKDFWGWNNESLFPGNKIVWELWNMRK